MNLPDLLTTLDAPVTAVLAAVWVWSLKRRFKEHREWSRERLQQWRHWYRQDMKETMEMLEHQQDTQERQQAQTEALMEEMKS